MNNYDNKSKGIKCIVYGFILSFLPFIGFFFSILIVYGIVLVFSQKNNIVIKKDDYDISQEEVHAHDYTDIQKDDVSQQQVHAHDGWDTGGPIKYNK